MYCKKCGCWNPESRLYCDGCGRKLQNDDAEKQSTQNIFAESVSSYESNFFGEEKISSKSRTVAFLFAFFFGWLGVHNFYMGNMQKGLIQAIAQIAIPILGVITLGIGFLLYIPLGIWVFIEMILILCGVAKDENGDVISNW